MTREQLEELANDAWDNADETPYKSRWDSAVEQIEEGLVEAGEATWENATKRAEALLREVIGPEHEHIIDPRQL